MITRQNRKKWTVTADSTGATATVNPSNPLQFTVNGTLGGGTVTLNSKVFEGTNWVQIGQLSAVGTLDGKIYAGHGEQFQVVVAGSTSPSIVAILEEVAG